MKKQLQFVILLFEDLKENVTLYMANAVIRKITELGG